MLAGEGPSFCAGADVEWMRASVDLDYDANVADATALRRMLEAVDSCPTPVIALVHGHALGGGAGLVACADMAIAHEATMFGFTEVKLGLIPAVISPFALAKIGPGPARRYFLTGERFDAETALRIGLVHEVTRTTSTLRSAAPFPSCEAPARGRPERQSGSCSIVPRPRRPHVGLPSAARARRARKASARSSSGARRPGTARRGDRLRSAR